MGEVVYLDTILVPMSVFVIVAYHAYLSHSINNKPSSTTFGTNKLNRSIWCLKLDQGDDKKAMLVIQSLRNTLMATILTATITILVNLALAALTNNSYTASHAHNDHHHHHILISSKLFGSKSDILNVLKYASASLFLVISFMFSSMAIGFLIDANFLMNANVEFLCEEGYTQTILERGFTLALIANRVLCSTLPLLLWMLGPIPMLLSSLALVWWLHHLDFVPKFPKY